MKRQQKFVEFKKKSVKEMDALRQENTKLRRKIEANNKE